MKSISTSLLEGFGLSPKYAPSSSELIIIGLITTLAKHKLLGEAILEVENNTDLSFDGSISPISEVASLDLLPYVYRSDTAVQLILQMTPYLPIMGSHILVDTGVKGNSAHNRRILTRGINVINARSHNLKLYLPHGSAEKIGVIKYTDKQDLLKTIQSLHLPASISDPLAW